MGINDVKRKYYFIFNEGSRVNQVICAILINIPVFVYGTTIGWMSPMTLLLQSKDSPRGTPLTDNEVSWMASAAYLVCIPSDFLMAILGDKIGRKYTIFIISATSVASWAFKLSSMSTWAFILARALVGVIMAGAYVTCPLYTKEISEDVVRGMLGCIVILFHTTGNLFLYIIGDYLNYQTILWICLALPTVHLVIFAMMPESPSYLLKKGHIKKATKALAWLRCRREDDIIILNELDQLNKEQSHDDKSSKFIFKALLNIPVFVYGTTIGWMSPMTLLLQSKDSPRGTPLTDNEVSWMASAAYLVCIPSDFLMAILGDKIGRKYTIFIISATSVASWAFKLSSMSTWAFILARALVGVIMAGAYVTCPLYTKEISEDVVRGMLGCIVILFHTTGNLFLYIIGDYLNYQTILWICLALPTVHLVIFAMMPESPSYLLKKGHIKKATKALAWLRCRREDDIIILNELDQLNKEQSHDDKSSKFIFKALLTDKILFRAFRIALVVTLAREVCGAIPVLNFAGEIFSLASKNTSLVLSPNQQAMMLGTIQVVGSVMTFGLVEKVGRKVLLIVTSLISGLSMCALASWFLAREHAVYAPSWLPIVTLCICIFCDAFGLQPISVVLNAELFSFKYRGTVMGATMASASIADFLQMLFFKKVMKSIGPYVAFYFFGAVCLLTAVYTIIAIPETKTRRLEEIYEDLKTKKEKKMDIIK